MALTLVFPFNPKNDGPFKGLFWGDGGRKITPCLKLFRIMLETRNSVRKYTYVY